MYIYHLLSVSATFNHIRFYATKVKPKRANASFATVSGEGIPSPLCLTCLSKQAGHELGTSSLVGINFTAEMYQKEILNPFPQSTYTLKLEAHNIQRPSFYSFGYDH